MASDDTHVAYNVEDRYEDPIPPTDSWGKFLSMRFGARRAFYDNLNISEQQMIWKELKRIEYFRNTFKTRKLSESDKFSLDFLLEEARKSWNTIAFERCKSELDRRQNSETEKRNCDILRAILRRGGIASPDDQFPITNEKDAIDLKNYNPDEPDYG